MELTHGGVYASWSLLTVEYTRWYIHTVGLTPGGDIYKEGHTYGGDINMEEQTYGKPYTWRGYIHGGNIHMEGHTEGYTHGGPYTLAHTHDGT